MMSLKSANRQGYSPIPPGTEQVGKKDLDAAFKVHTALGPGLVESADEHCLAYELRQMGIQAQTQVLLPIVYRNEHIDAGWRIDLLVENCVIVELKAVEEMRSLFDAQLLTYMKLANIRLGYLLNLMSFV